MFRLLAFLLGAVLASCRLFVVAFVPGAALKSQRQTSTTGVVCAWDLLSAVSAKESSLDERPETNEGSHTNIYISGMDAVTRFHKDMRRVLELRRKTSMANNSKSSSTSILSEYFPMSRHKRPTLLMDDVDGAVRVISMLRRMVNIGIATEESFQIVFEALCERGRLRWKTKESGIVCAADEVEGLIEELWMRQGGKVSTETCNLSLRIYAACSTPRGDRHYAQKAQTLLNSMNENGIVPSIESYSHVINAWAWQQGNLDDGKCAEMAQSNFDELMRMYPDDGSVMQALDWILEAWSKSLSADAPSRAERILHQMKLMQSKNSTNILSLPNSQSYANAILAFAKSKRESNAERAHNMLFELIERYEEGSLPDGVEPNLFAISK
jgi:hypothetical protein